MIPSMNLSIYLPVRWKKNIEGTTKRLFKSLQQKIKKIKETISSVETLINDDATSSSSLSDSGEDVQIVNPKDKKQSTTTTTKPKKQINKPITASAETTANQTTTANTNTHTTSIQSSIKTNDSIKKPKGKKVDPGSLDPVNPGES
ncbi:unnamed protein product [Rotaria socialis]|uniref:Uncharacterized protein n=1 Tax=Rotaria socialis TaxID=392032 RepID=A0A818KDB2_9BILA|nr:unnamed protein product [Rotaria socialis]